MSTAAVLAIVTSSAIALANPRTHDVRLPRGTRTNASGELVSARGLRDTTDAITKDLDRRGIAFQKIGPYRVRGVELTRFLSQTPSTTWLAIHILRTGGKTLIFFVARPPLDETARAR
jgi:hypothetical protein